MAERVRQLAEENARVQRAQEELKQDYVALADKGIIPHDGHVEFCFKNGTEYKRK